MQEKWKCFGLLSKKHYSLSNYSVPPPPTQRALKRARELERKMLDPNTELDEELTLDATIPINR